MTALQLLAALRGEGVRLWWQGGELHYEVPRPGAQVSAWLRELAAHKQSLAALMGGAAAAAAGLSPAAPGEVPASSEQRRFLFLEALEGPADTYNLVSCFHIRGRLEIPALAQALHAVTRQHSVLRTRFRRADGGWQQQVVDAEAPLALTDLSGLPAAQRETWAQQLVARDRQLTFDLAGGPHWRARLLTLAAQQHQLLLVTHHIVSDGQSIRLFAAALREAYLARLAGRPAAAPAGLQYRDYAAWQQGQAGQGEAADLDYWRASLAGAPPRLDLEIARPRPPRASSAGAVHTFRVDAAWPALLALCAAQQLTPFQVLLAAQALNLARHARSQDLVLGAPMDTRRGAEQAGIIGPFINLLPLRISLRPDDTGLSLLQRVRQTVLAGMQHAGLAFEKIVEALAPARSAAHAPLFQHLFALEDLPPDLLRLPGAEVSVELVDHASAKYDTALIVQRDTQGYFGLIRHRADLYSAAAAAQLAEAFLHILGELCGRRAQPLAQLGTLDAAALARRQSRFTGEHQPDFGRCALHELFEQQVRRTPQLLALKCAGHSLSYASLDARANQYAHWLRAHGAGPGRVVGIVLEHGIAMVCAVLGASKAGAAYVPASPDDPPARLAYCLGEAGASLVVGSAARPLPAQDGMVFLDADDPAIDAQPGHSPGIAVDPRWPVSVLYTSGSTGLPKAVVTEHGALVNNLQWMQRCWPLGPGDRLLFKAPLTFDVSAKEIVWPLMAGAAVVIGRSGGRHDPAYLSRLMREDAVTVVHLVPTMLEYFIGEAGSARELPLRIVMCGGEALTPALLARFHAAFDAELLHLYGPTEAAIAITGCVLPPPAEAAPLPLGLATDNSAVYLLDEDLQPAPCGVAGEIFIGGLAVARGYQGRPGATAAAFLPDPFAATPGQRMYATGDLARITGAGDLLYIGRRDHQIKLYGQRIELGEIEVAIKRHDRVRECVVVAAAGPGGKPALRAFIVAQPGRPPAEAELAAFLRQHLAAHMLPAAYVFLDALPLMSNGKADRAGLAARPAGPAVTAPPATAATPAAPREAEQRLAAIWRGLLEREDVGLEENFFSAGGHSLLAIELRNRIRDEFGQALDVADVFAHPTIQAQALLLQPAGASPPPPPAAAPAAVADTRIAVIGMAGRFPGADELDGFWRNIAGGVDSLRRFSRAELLAAGYPAEVLAQPGFVPARGVIEGVEDFDAGFFGCTPMEAALLDPQHRLLLECAQWALDDAGYSAAALGRQGARVGTFVGVSASSYYENNLRSRPELRQKYGSLQLSLSTGKSYAATQIAFRLNLQGPAVGVDSACSSALVAVAMACQALLQGEAELALAGGASIDVPAAGGHLWQDGGVGSRDGHCRPFDAEGSGTVKGMGGGLVLLKPLAAALRDGDAVHAVILGAATNNDGAAKVGFSAPGVAGQTAVLRAALQRAGVAAESVGYVETHGTGTPLGDPIEARSLAQVYGGGAVTLGALKGNIGHLDAAAGIAGLIKTVLVLRQGVLPPLANFRSPNPQLGLPAGFVLPHQARPWPAGATPRRAAVSAFGIGGTNAHLVLEQAPEPPPAETAGQQAELLLVSAHTPAALAAALRALVPLLQDESLPLAAISYTLATGRAAQPWRRALYGDRAALLRQCRDVAPPPAPAAARPRLALLFPGQGAGMDGVVRQLYGREAGFTRWLDQALAQLAALEGFDYAAHLQQLLAPDGAAHWLDDPAAAQPWQFAVAVSLAQSLGELGLAADICLGHSLGEYAAACAAGVFDLSQGLALLQRRGALVAACPPGRMLAVAADEAQVRTLLIAGSELAAVNSASQCVVSGTPGAVAEVAAAARSRGLACRPLALQRAIHSAQMDTALEPFAAALAGQVFAPPACQLISSLSGQAWVAGQAPGASHWIRQLREPVQFRAALAALQAAQPDVCLELGAGGVLTALAAEAGLSTASAVLPLLGAGPRGEDLPGEYLQALGALWERGLALDWQACFSRLGRGPAQGYRRAHLPGTHFERRRHWVDAPAAARSDASQPPLARAAWARLGLPAPRPPLPLCLGHDGSAAALRLLADLQATGAAVSAFRLPADAGEAPRLPPGPAAWLLLTGAALLDIGDGAAALDPLRRLAAQAAALAGAQGVPGLSLVAGGVLDVTGAERRGAPWRAALAALATTAGAQPACQFIDLPARWTRADAGLLPALAAQRSGGLAAVRNASVWQLLPAAIAPPPALAGTFSRGQSCVVLDDGLAAAAEALAASLQQHGAGVRRLAVPAGQDAWPLVTTGAGPAPAAVFLLLADTPGANPATRLLQLDQALRAGAGQLRSVIALVGSRGASTPGSLATALAALLEQLPGGPPFLVLESDLWREDEPGLLSAGFAFAAAALRAQPNALLCAGAAALLHWQAEATAACAAQAPAEPASAAPQGEEAVAVAAHWRDLLGIDAVGAEDNFFTLGGDSLLAGQSLAFLNRRFGVGIGAQAFQANASAQGLARLIVALRRAREPVPAASGAAQARAVWEL